MFTVKRYIIDKRSKQTFCSTFTLAFCPQKIEVKICLQTANKQDFREKLPRYAEQKKSYNSHSSRVGRFTTL